MTLTPETLGPYLNYVATANKDGQRFIHIKDLSAREYLKESPFALISGEGCVLETFTEAELGKVAAFCISNGIIIDCLNAPTRRSKA